MHGLTGNIYYGLAEFADMGFLLHFLRSDDCLADIGANAGSYSVMAARLCGAHAIAFEPAAETWPALLRNIALNEIEGRVQAHQTALAANPGSAVMSTGQGSMNRLVEVDAGDVQEVALDTADAVLVSAGITAVKIDVEGAEEGVIEGAAELLRQPQLVAISIESLPGRTRDLIEQCGFREFFYDPHTREVTDRDPGLGANNHLFLRHESLAHVRERVAAAPAIRYGKLRLDRPDSV